MTSQQMDPTAIRADLEQVRYELADTISALAHKADVRSRVEQKVHTQVKSLMAATAGLSGQLDTGLDLAKRYALPPIRSAIENPGVLVSPPMRRVLVSLLIAFIFRSNVRKR
jgi:hypothetical protein